MAVGCGSAAEPTVKTEEARSGEILLEEETDAQIKDDDKDTAESQENTSGKWQVLEPDIAAAADADIPDSRQETDKEETADTKTTETETNDVELPKPEITEEDGKASPEDEENTVCDPIAGIVEKYQGNTITIKNPDEAVKIVVITVE